MQPIVMAFRVVLILALVSFSVAQLDDLENRLSALERVLNAIMADFPQYFTQDGIADYLTVDDTCYKCDAEVSKLQETINNQTQVIAELEGTVEALSLRLDDVTAHVNVTENFIATPGTAFYNYLDEIAQASCSALTSSYWVWAVPRNCGPGNGMTCDQVCASMGQSSLDEIGVGSFECFDAFHVSRSALGLRSYRYLRQSGCSWRPNHCGPNYCCCKRSD